MRALVVCTMTGNKVLELENVISPDLLATRLTEKYIEWDTSVPTGKLIRKRYDDMSTLRIRLRRLILITLGKTGLQYLSSAKYEIISTANYTATLFPKRKWLVWEANDKDCQRCRKAG
jgi:hypothetical protein